MKTIYRTQAELEARDVSTRDACTVSVYKLGDGRYQVERGSDADRGGSLIARWRSGEQEV